MREGLLVPKQLVKLMADGDTDDNNADNPDKGRVASVRDGGPVIHSTTP